jgi:hypothetical protein
MQRAQCPVERHQRPALTQTAQSSCGLVPVAGPPGIAGFVLGGIAFGSGGRPRPYRRWWRPACPVASGGLERETATGHRRGSFILDFGAVRRARHTVEPVGKPTHTSPPNCRRSIGGIGSVHRLCASKSGARSPSRRVINFSLDLRGSQVTAEVRTLCARTSLALNRLRPLHGRAVLDRG